MTDKRHRDTRTHFGSTLQTKVHTRLCIATVLDIYCSRFGLSLDFPTERQFELQIQTSETLLICVRFILADIPEVQALTEMLQSRHYNHAGGHR